MKTRNGFSILLFLITIAINGFASADTRANISQTMELAGGKIHEECMQLDVADILRYEFEASLELVFNVHYHVGEEIIFPIEDHLSQGEESSMTIETEQHYCLMWTNRNLEASDLEYRVTVK